MKKIIGITVSIFIFGMIVSISSASVPQNDLSLPITQLSNSQIKKGGLSLSELIVGNLTNYFKFLKTKNGFLGIALPESESEPKEALDVNGSIRLSVLNIPNRKVCATKNGDITTCGSSEFHYGKDCSYNQSGNLSCSNSSGTAVYSVQEFKVPEGVTKMTVEVWGAGGAGFDIAGDYHAPDTYNNCYYSDTYNCSDGGNGTFIFGSTELIKSFGGKAARAKNTAGVGGGTFYNSSWVNLIQKVENADGGVGYDGGNPETKNITCGSNNYVVTIGGSGGEGGKGGLANSSSGILGAQGPSVNKALFDLDVNDQCAANFPGVIYTGLTYKFFHGNNGLPGSGGSGASGLAGGSDLYPIGSGCYIDPQLCTPSKKGFAGGGGGGYVKGEINVTPGDIYKFKLYRGGVAKTYGEKFFPNPDKMWLCSDCYGPKSGNGGNAWARISY